MERLFTFTFFFTLFLTSTAIRAQNAQQIYVQGIITTEGQTLAGATVKVDGKSTISEKDGLFMVRVEKAGTYKLKATHIGFTAKEIVIEVSRGMNTVNLELHPETAKLAGVTVTATENERSTLIGKSGLAVKDLPQSYVVINNQTIKNQQAQRLSDVIKNVSGVSLADTRGANSETFFARGYRLGANNIMKNGSRANSAVIPEASTLEKVEVLKGSAALLYGNVDGGAVINMVTKEPQFKFGGEVSFRTGSYGLIKPIGDLYGPVNKKVAYRIVSTYENANSYRKGVNSSRTYVNPSLLFKFNPKTSLLVQGDYLKNDYTPDFGIGTIDNKIPEAIDRAQSFNPPWAYAKIRQSTASATLNHKINSTWKATLIGSYQKYGRNYFSTERIAANDEGDWSRSLTRAKTEEDYYTAQANLTGAFSTGVVKHNVLVGTDAERYMNISNAFSFASAYDKINILDETKYTPRTDEPATTPVSRSEAPTYRLGYYVQDLVSLSPKLKVLAGLRWSYQKAALAKTFDAVTDERIANTTKTKVDKAFSPRLGLVFQPNNRTSLFVSYSNNFSENRGRDIYDANLKPSLIDQYEAGVKRDFLAGKLSVNVTAYRIINNDLALQAPYDRNGGDNTDSQVKEFSGQTTSDGIETDITGNIAKGLNFLAGYSYNFMRYTQTPGGTGSYIVGERLVNNPAHTANAALFYTVPSSKLKGLKLGASAVYTGERNAGWNNTVGQSQKYNRLIPVSGFTTVDVSAGYAFGKFTVLGKLSNITNTLNYYVHENYSVNPIPPRQFITTLSYKF
ncbi:MAG: TonB-dependent receptor [Sphingobacteriaceae bacterium]|jgi:iron complex outermembrane receptor protein|nr:TonB-dependent receptor [Sphingobacteriaceae bacterium]